MVLKGPVLKTMDTTTTRELIKLYIMKTQEADVECSAQHPSSQSAHLVVYVQGWVNVWTIIQPFRVRAGLVSVEGKARSFFCKMKANLCCS